MPAGKANLGPNFYPKLVQISSEVGMRPEDLLAVMVSESGLNNTAYEQKFKGSGLIGFMPNTLTGIGFKGTWEDFTKLSGEDQLDYVKKVVQNNMKLNGGPFTSAGQYYVANLWPIGLKLPGVRQGDPKTAILEENPERGGPGNKYSKKYLDIGSKIDADFESRAYKANPLFDRDKKGAITFGDMIKQTEINKKNPIYQKAIMAMHDATGYQPGKEAPSMVAQKDKDDSLKQYVDYMKRQPGESAAPAPANSIEPLLDQYLRQVAAYTKVSLAGDRVQREKTDVSEAQMAQAIIEAWRELFGKEPAKEQVSLVLAQNALETGHRKFMWNFNVGNITTDGKGTFNYFDDLATDEQITPGVWKKMNLKYRAYPSLRAGVVDYLRLLSQKGGRYAKAWENIINPDPVAFSKALKAGGYYTANEAPYTKTLTSLFDKFNKSDSYEQARSGKVKPPSEKGQPTMVAQQDNSLKQYVDYMKKQPSDSTPVNTNVEPILTQYLQQVAASEKQYKKLYKQFLPLNHVLIKVQAANYTDTVEFSRILCSVLDTELMSRSFTHTDNRSVDVECAIHGPAEDCFEAVQQLTQATAEAFKKATVKIGGIDVKTQFLTNKKSSYQQIDSKFANTQYRKFLLKFI